MTKKQLLESIKHLKDEDVITWQEVQYIEETMGPHHKATLSRIDEVTKDVMKALEGARARNKDNT